MIDICKVKDYYPISELIVHPENPRDITPQRMDDLKQSMIKKGFYQPILVWNKNYWVLSGNHRLIAARELLKEGYEFKSAGGVKAVLPVVWITADEALAQKILYESNNSYADWIDDKVRESLEEAQEAGKNIRDFGFTQDEVDKLLVGAIKEAETITESVTLSPAAPPAGAMRKIEAERLGTLVIQKEVCDDLIYLLGDISQKLSPLWVEGDSLSAATQALVQLFHEKKLLDKI